VWRSIRVKLVVVNLLLIMFALELIGAYFVRNFTATLISSDTNTAEKQAQLIATIAVQKMVSSAQGSDGTQQHIAILPSLGQVFSGAIYVLDKEGVVVDSSAGPALIGQKRTDSVSTQALISHARSVAIRYDSFSQQHLLAVAVPITDGTRFYGVVEYVVPIQTAYETVRQVSTIFYTVCAIALALTALLGIILSRTITRPVLDVTRQARQMAKGNFKNRLTIHSDDEFGELTTAINDLADKLDDALEANARERERLQAVIKYMGDGVIAFAADFRLLFQNDAAHRLLAEEAGPLDKWLNLASLRKEGHERSFLKQTGESVLSVHVTAIRRDDDIEAYVAVLHDVTEQEKLQNARRDFVANVSHELRTPLTSIKSYIEALLDDIPDEQTKDEFLHVVNQETDRMVRITEDLLHLSGLEMANLPFRPISVDVKSWLAECVQRFQLEALERKVEMSLHCPRTNLLWGDRDMLDRLLDNLLGNAIKYTQSGGTVEVVATFVQEELRLRVEDTGIGIPETDLPHVFERFYRVDKARSRKMGGTGLGLAIVREIVERHGGTLSISSKVGSGTTVYVTLPLSEEGR